MTSLQTIVNSRKDNEEANKEREAKMVAFVRDRLIDYYEQKIVYYVNEIKHWKANDTGEIPDEVINTVLADLNWEIKRKTF